MAPRLNGTTTRVRVSGPCALAHLPAAERRLMVTPPSPKKGQKRRITACLKESLETWTGKKMENPEKSIVPPWIIWDYLAT